MNLTKQPLPRRRVIAAAVAVACFALTVGVGKLARADEIVQTAPPVTITATPSLGPLMPSASSSILSNSLVPAGARPIYGGSIDKDGGAGTIVGYRVVTPINQPGAPLQAAGAVAAIGGIATGNVVLGAVGGVAAGVGTIVNMGAAGTVPAGTVVMFQPYQIIAPMPKFSGRNGN